MPIGPTELKFLPVEMRWTVAREVFNRLDRNGSSVRNFFEWWTFLRQDRLEAVLHAVNYRRSYKKKKKMYKHYECVWSFALLGAAMPAQTSFLVV